MCVCVGGGGWGCGGGGVCVCVFPLMGGPLNDILVIGGTILEVLAPVSPCHSLVQNFMDSVCNIF